MAAALAPALPTEQVIYQIAAATSAAGAPPVCFAAGLAGLVVSRDGGQTWADAYASLRLDQPLPTLSVTVAAAGAEVFAGYNGGLLRSRDGGGRWENVPFAAPPPALAALALSPNYAEDGTLFAGTLADGVYYSTDRGAHWRTGNLGLIDLNVLCLALAPDFASRPTIFAGTQSGLFCSRNAGRSWREVELPCGYDAVLSLAGSPNFARDATLYIGTETHGLFTSTDAGQNWQRVGAAALGQSVSQIRLAPKFPHEPRLLVLHDGRLSTSADGGGTWRPWSGMATLPADAAITAFLAPRGFGTGEVVLMALDGGGLRQVTA